jgi:hypothetical protein
LVDVRCCLGDTERLSKRQPDGDAEREAELKRGRVLLRLGLRLALAHCHAQHLVHTLCVTCGNRHDLAIGLGIG